MEPLESELEDLSRLYKGLHKTLAAFDEPCPGKDTIALVEQVLQNRELLSRIEQMDSRIGTLAAEWEELRGRLDPPTTSRIRQMAENLRSQAANLKQLVDRRIHQIEYSCVHLEQKLSEIRKGERFLKSVKPITVNYPKFIDSLG